VHVLPRSLDVTDDSPVGEDPLAGDHRRHDVPVLVHDASAGADGDRVAMRRHDRHDPVEGRVHTRAVRGRDVDAEMERSVPFVVPCDARVAEVAANRMLPVERLDGPSIGGASRRSNGEDERCDGGRCRERAARDV
jgi:hypothetical protein